MGTANEINELLAKIRYLLRLAHQIWWRTTMLKVLKSDKALKVECEGTVNGDVASEVKLNSKRRHKDSDELKVKNDDNEETEIKLNSWNKDAKGVQSSIEARRRNLRRRQGDVNEVSEKSKFEN